MRSDVRTYMGSNTNPEQLEAIKRAGKEFDDHHSLHKGNEINDSCIIREATEEAREWAHENGKPLEGLGFKDNTRTGRFRATEGAQCLYTREGCFCFDEGIVEVRVEMGGEMTIFMSDVETEWCCEMAKKAIDTIHKEMI